MYLKKSDTVFALLHRKIPEQESLMGVHIILEETQRMHQNKKFNFLKNSLNVNDPFQNYRDSCNAKLKFMQYI